VSLRYLLSCGFKTAAQIFILYHHFKILQTRKIINMKEIISLLSLLEKTINIVFPFLKSYLGFNAKNKMVNLINLDVESITFLPDDLKEFYKEGQRRALFYIRTGIDASSSEQKLISKLSLEINNKFSWFKLKIASQYFKYNENDISINIRKVDRGLANFFMLFSIMLLLAGFTTIFLNLSSLFQQKETIKLFAATLSIGIISIVLGVHLISTYVAPVNVAQSIEKQLKAIENKTNN